MINVEKGLSSDAGRITAMAWLRSNYKINSQLHVAAIGMEADPIRRCKDELYIVTARGEILGLALVAHGDGTSMLISEMGLSEVHALMQAIDADQVQLTDVCGPLATAAAVAEMFGKSYRERFVLGMYGISQYALAASAKDACRGGMRPARVEDTALLNLWLGEFIAECRLKEDLSSLEEKIKRRLLLPTPYYWLLESDGVAVAACSVQYYLNYARIGAVYVARHSRGEGFGLRLVSSVLQHLFSGGVKEVFLSADLASTAANGLYRGLGFELLARHAHHDIFG